MATDDPTTEGPADTQADEASQTEPETEPQTTEGTTEGTLEADTAEGTVDAEEATESAAEVEEPPGSDAEELVDEQAQPSSEQASGSGTPGIPPPVRDERRSEDGLPLTTTTGDPDKDFRGPSVTEEARRGMEDDTAMDEPGYADLGHAEDYRVLRED
jgi:hypothetical protein